MAWRRPAKPHPVGSIPTSVSLNASIDVLCPTADRVTRKGFGPAVPNMDYEQKYQCQVSSEVEHQIDSGSDGFESRTKSADNRKRERAG